MKIASGIARIDDIERFHQQGVTFALRASDVLATLWHDKHFTGSHGDCFVAKRNFHFAIQNDEYLVGPGMAVPHEFTLKFHQLELIVVHLRDDSRRPMVVELGELLGKIDGVVHFHLGERAALS